MTAPSDCSLCPALAACRSCVVNGVGPDGARIAIVGQNPGQTEDKSGKPFQGPSGKLLAKLCESAGIRPSSVFRTNAVRCLSPDNRPPKRDEIVACRGYLIDELRALNPSIIIAMGDTALQSLYALADNGEYDNELAYWEDECTALHEEYDVNLNYWATMSTTERRKLHVTKPLKPKLPKKPKRPPAKHVTLRDVVGHTLVQPDLGIPMIATYHPAYLMRGHWEETGMVVEHFKKAKRISEGTQTLGQLGDYATIENLNQLRALRDYLLSDEVDTIWYDTETTGKSWKTDELLCISFAGEAGEGFVVPILHNPGDGEPDLYPPWEGNMKEVRQILTDIFGSDKPKGGQNMLFDLRFLEREPGDVVDALTAFGIKVNGRLMDTELLHHSIAETLPHNMTTLLATYTDLPFYEDDIHGKKKAMAKVPNQVLWPYSAADADGLPRLWDAMRPIAESEGVDWVLDNITEPLLRFCRNLEDRGFPIDVEHFERLCLFYDDQIAQEEARLWQTLPSRGPGWKYNYPPVLRDILFGELKLKPSGRKTEKSRECDDCKDGVCFVHDQTGKDALAEINGQTPHPILPILMRLKKLTKLRGTNLGGAKGNAGFRKFISRDERIHPSMKVSRAETGRLASEAPNCQNMPNYLHIHPIGATCSDSGCTAFYAETYGINSENAYHDLVKAKPGKGIMNADWSQLEVWVLGYRLYKDTGDRTLLDVLESGIDIHLFMARKMFPEVDPDMSDRDWKNTHADLRRRAKTMVFGVGYGLTPQGALLKILPDDPNATIEEAQDLINRYLAVVPGLPRYFRIIRKMLDVGDDVVNEFDRRRHTTVVNLLKAMGQRGDLEGLIRENINFPIQSGGSDLHSSVSVATDNLESLQNRGCYAILTVHDSLTFEFDWPDNDEALKTAWIIKQLWQDIAWDMAKPDGSHLHWKVPIEVEWGQTWGTPEYKLDAKGSLQELKP